MRAYPQCRPHDAVVKPNLPVTVRRMDKRGHVIRLDLLDADLRQYGWLYSWAALQDQDSTTPARTSEQWAPWSCLTVLCSLRMDYAASALTLMMLTKMQRS